MSNLLDTVGRYAFTVIGLEITIGQSTDSKPSVDSWKFQELELGFTGTWPIFGQNFNFFLRKIYDF